jgi:cell division protein FtsB
MTDQYNEQDVELDDDENEVLEAHDPMNAELNSVDSVDKAAKAVAKKAPARKGDLSNAEPMPKTKSGMINAMYNKMAKMKKEDLSSTFKKMMGEDYSFDEEMVAESSDYKEDLEALIKNDKTLSDEFKVKAATIFEAAVSSKVAEKESELNEAVSQRIQELEEEYATEIKNGLNEEKEKLVDKIDSYLNYVVENWMEENKIAIEKGLRTEIAENFMNNLKTLFVESYIEVPESKVDLVDELSEQLEEVRKKLDKTTEDNMKLKETVVSLKKESIINESGRDLAATQALKLHKLSENIEFVSEKDFESKVLTIKESYFSQKPAESSKVLIEEVEEESADNIQETTSETMSRYLSVLRQSK